MFVGEVYNIVKPLRSRPVIEGLEDDCRYRKAHVPETNMNGARAKI
jgi:hypothetical protein